MADHDSSHKPNASIDAWKAKLASGQLLKMPVARRLSEHQKFFADWDATRHGPAPVWAPTQLDIANSNLKHLMSRCDVDSFESLEHYWQTKPNEFWTQILECLNIQFFVPAKTTLEFQDPRAPKWLADAKLNIVQSCFQADPESIAIRFAAPEKPIQEITYGHLLSQVQTLAAQLANAGFSPGDPIAVAMPMTAQSVVIYLAILYAGCTAVSIADSFAASEIAKRLKIANAKAIFFADQFQRSGKTIDLGTTVRKAVEACARSNQSITLFTDRHEFPVATPLPKPHAADPSDTINVLFSSGTTGDPKAIPWDHTTPVKCAADGRFHQNIKAGDVVVWPTNLGWMMGPWLIFASLINRATIGLFHDAPTGDHFGKFVQDAETTMLGVVPALVRHWKQTACMEPFAWSSIRCFSSTGEASNPADMTYLSSLAGFRPVIEYCGGTEVGGGYISSTVIQPNVPAAFSSPGIGSRFAILDDNGSPADEGELYLVPPTMGLSGRLLNRDHFDTYYSDVPQTKTNLPLRRHGDRMQRLPNGYWRACGRMDDTMNPGGIKIGSAEIETIINAIDAVQASAVIAAPAAGNGPDELIAFLVLKCQETKNVLETADSESLRNQINQAIRSNLNPLIRISQLRIVNSLPRTASNKIMRRQLRDQLDES